MCIELPEWSTCCIYCCLVPSLLRISLSKLEYSKHFKTLTPVNIFVNFNEEFDEFQNSILALNFTKKTLIENMSLEFRGMLSVLYCIIPEDNPIMRELKFW